MRFSIFFLVLFLSFSSCAQNSKNPIAFEDFWMKDASQFGIDQNTLRKIKSEESDFVARLTGVIPVKDEILLKSRWNLEERTLTREFLTKRLESLDLEVKTHEYSMNLPWLNKQKNPAEGINVYSVIPATSETDEYVLLGAHFDTVEGTPGASDNATGCALVYGVTKLLLTQEVRSKNVLIVFLDKEEVGHAGAFAFAKYLKDNSFNIHSVHTADQVGWDKDLDRNIEIEVPSNALKDLYRKHAKDFGIKAYKTRETGSDHKEFREAGFESVGITEEYRNGDTSPFHHDPGDTYKTVDFDYLGFVTYLVFRVFADLTTN